MDNGNGFLAASGITGQAATGSAEGATRDLPRGALRPQAPGHDDTPAARSAGPDDDGTVGPGEALTAALDAGQPAEEAPPLTLLAEWALWGKDERNTGYHVMRCSKGQLADDNFSEIITRYGSGVKSNLPQFTVCWIPDPDRNPEYLAIGIHEVIEPGSPSAGGRSRNVGGRVVEYVRMFCFRYADVAEFEASYTQLVKAVADTPLDTSLVDHGGRADLKLQVDLPPGLEPPDPSGAERQLAQDVALALLTGSPVCVLDADGVPAERRLAFIDLVLSLLPFGLRATLSASTWARTTLQELKLRLYFSNAPREDNGRTWHVSWVRPGQVRIPEGHAAARLYQEWLREAGPGAIEDLTHKRDPIRFIEADERQMLASLPNDKTIAETLEELSAKLRAVDRPAVSAIVRRLRRYLASPQSPADRTIYRSLILKHRLFRDHAKIHGNVKSSVYKTLLSLGFEERLSYADYCEIEDSIAGEPGWTLRKVLLQKTRISVLAYVLAATAESGIGYAELRDALALQNKSAVWLLDILEREMDTIRPRHRKSLTDFTVWYLTRSADLTYQWQGTEDPRAVLYSRGYLTDLLNHAFPKDQAEQRDRLSGILTYVYGERLGPKQICEIFEAPRLYPGPVLEVTVKGLAPSRRWHLVEQQYHAARIRHGGYANDLTKALQSVRVSMPWPSWRPRAESGTQPGLGMLLLALLTGVVIVGLIVFALALI